MRASTARLGKMYGRSKTSYSFTPSGPNFASDGASICGRLTLFERFTRYTNPQAEAAAKAYVALARKHGIDPAQLALAYVNSRPFVTSNIIGATTLEQLRSNIDSLSVQLSQEIIEQIDAIHKTQPNPAP
nr:aldo/keto reductase [Herbaspirillum lusitanum]